MPQRSKTTAISTTSSRPASDRDLAAAAADAETALGAQPSANAPSRRQHPQRPRPQGRGVRARRHAARRRHRRVADHAAPPVGPPRLGGEDGPARRLGGAGVQLLVRRVDGEARRADRRDRRAGERRRRRVGERAAREAGAAHDGGGAAGPRAARGAAARRGSGQAPPPLGGRRRRALVARAPLGRQPRSAGACRRQRPSRRRRRPRACST